MLRSARLIRDIICARSYAQYICLVSKSRFTRERERTGGLMSQGSRLQASLRSSSGIADSDDLQAHRTVRLLSTLMRGAGISVRAIDPRITDPISQLTVEALLARGPLTVSGISRYVKEVKGSSSRTTIRQRIRALETSDVVRTSETGTEWTLTRASIQRIWDFWTRWLGPPGSQDPGFAADSEVPHDVDYR